MDSQKVLQQTREVLQRTGEVLQRTGEVLQRTGEVLQWTGEVLQWTEEVLQRTGGCCNEQERWDGKGVAIFDGGWTTMNDATTMYSSYHKSCNKVPCTLLSSEVQKVLQYVLQHGSNQHIVQ